MIGPVGNLAISRSRHPGGRRSSPGRQPGRTQVQGRIQPAIDLCVHRTGLTVSDDCGIADDSGWFHEMEQGHPAHADQDEDHRQGDCGLLFAVVVLHTHREARDRGPQSAIVEQVARILVTIGKIQGHAAFSLRSESDERPATSSTQAELVNPGFPVMLISAHHYRSPPP